jgi:SAM-dependent methyltransferase
MSSNSSGPSKVVLNVGAGSSNIGIPDYYASWRQERLDIDPKCKPDVLLDARNLRTLKAETYDAIYCSHNLEHYHRRDAALVIQGFAHILKPDGFVEIAVPDLAWVMRHVVEQHLDIDDLLYHTASGMPILVRDVIFGYHKEVEIEGNDFFLHKTGFTPPSLVRLCHQNGLPYNAVGSRFIFEITGFFFKQYPTEEHQRLLGLSKPA